VLVEVTATARSFIGSARDAGSGGKTTGLGTVFGCRGRKSVP
jgi:hypothetical protein